MSFVDDVDSLKTKLHLRDMPTPLRIGLIILGAVVLFILFQGLWQLGAGESHLIKDPAQSSWQEESGASDQAGIAPTEAEDGDASAQSVPATVSVHIVGAVKHPGLYEVEAGSRIKEVVDAAGGLKADAEEGSINLARTVSDGEQIVVGTKGSANPSGAASTTSTSAGGASGQPALVNINTADVAGLSSLSGIGEATAKKIIADREKNGPFKSKKDITRVSGIGDKKYEALKDSITV